MTDYQFIHAMNDLIEDFGNALVDKDDGAAINFAHDIVDLFTRWKNGRNGTVVVGASE